MVALPRIAGLLSAALIVLSTPCAEALTWMEATRVVEAEDFGAIKRHIQEGEKQGLKLSPVFMILAAQRDQVDLLENFARHCTSARKPTPAC